MDDVQSEEQDVEQEAPQTEEEDIEINSENVGENNPLDEVEAVQEDVVLEHEPQKDFNQNLSDNVLDHPSKKIEQPNDDSTEGFVIHKAEREIELLDNLQSWLAARCHQLGDIETFAYPYYGMLVDLMRQVVKDIQAVLDLENEDIVAQYYPNGLDVLTRKKEAVEADIQTAVENCESNTTALIEEGMDLNKVKKALGDLDTSTEKEYLGPAPDGFELLDDKPIDEEAVKEQYEQLEEKAQKDVEKQDISVTDEKKTSQNEQNGVQRKLSFSLKPKKG